MYGMCRKYPHKIFLAACTQKEKTADGVKWHYYVLLNGSRAESVPTLTESFAMTKQSNDM